MKRLPLTADTEPMSFEVMPFDLMTAPSTFQQMMDVTFRVLPFVRVWVDDVETFSSTMEKHLKNPKTSIRSDLEGRPQAKAA